MEHRNGQIDFETQYKQDKFFTAFRLDKPNKLEKIIISSIGKIEMWKRYLVNQQS